MRHIFFSWSSWPTKLYLEKRETKQQRKIKIVFYFLRDKWKDEK